MAGSSVSIANGVSAGQTPVPVATGSTPGIMKPGVGMTVDGTGALTIAPAVLGAVSTLTPSASPYTYQNTTSRAASIIVTGGIVTTISVSRDGTNFTLVGIVTGMFDLSAGDYIRIVYTTVPTVTLIPR